MTGDGFNKRLFVIQGRRVHIDIFICLQNIKHLIDCLHSSVEHFSISVGMDCSQAVAISKWRQAEESTFDSLYCRQDALFRVLQAMSLPGSKRARRARHVVEQDNCRGSSLGESGVLGVKKGWIPMEESDRYPMLSIYVGYEAIDV